jgi:uncharacterized membrane protein
MIVVLIAVGVLVTIALILLAFYQILDFALFNSQGSPFGMICGFFSIMGLIAVVWVIITILMWFLIFSGTGGRRPRKPRNRCP